MDKIETETIKKVSEKKVVTEKTKKSQDVNVKKKANNETKIREKKNDTGKADKVKNDKFAIEEKNEKSIEEKAGSGIENKKSKIKDEKVNRNENKIKKDEEANKTEVKIKKDKKVNNTVEKIKSEKKEENEEYIKQNIEEKKNIENLEDDYELENSKNEQEDSKFDTISLKEIEEALKNKVGSEQRKNIFKEALINFGIAIFMIFHLAMLFMGNRNIETGIFQNDIKVITIFILAIGIAILEVAYRKDNSKLALNGLEVLVFGAANVCLICVFKLYVYRLSNFLSYIAIALTGYYIFKILLVLVFSIRKYKKDNNDIKDIVKR